MTTTADSTNHVWNSQLWNGYHEARLWSAAWKRAAKLFYRRYVETYGLMMEARVSARRLLKERDEIIEKLNHSQIDNVALRRSNLALRECLEKGDEWEEYGKTMFEENVSIRAERDKALYERDMAIATANDSIGVLEGDYQMAKRERDELERGLTLATLCDIVLGGDATDRSDNALVKGVGMLKRDNARLREALEHLEWVHRYWETLGWGDYYCLWCGKRQADGHASDCPRQVALGLAK
jgi:hypothetical protein